MTELKALKRAKRVIHGFYIRECERSGRTDEEQMNAWGIYNEKAPEMIIINAAIARAAGGDKDGGKP